MWNNRFPKLSLPINFPSKPAANRAARWIVGSLMLFASSALFLTPAHASSFADQKARFVQHCVGDSGESQAICECTFDQWQSKVTPDQEPAAVVALDLMVTGREPTMEEMFSSQGQMMAYSQVLMSCMTGSASSGGFDLGAMMSGTAGSTPSIADLQAQSEQMEREKQQQREQRIAKQAAQDKQLEASVKQWKADIAQAQSDLGQPLNSPVSAYKNLHGLRCKGHTGQNDLDFCACEWNLISSYSSPAGDRVTRAVAYMISDDYLGDLPFNMSSSESSATFEGVDRLSNSISSSCN